MNKGVTLVELMVSLAIASMLILVVYGVHAMGQGTTREIRDGWYCMQSIRTAVLQIDSDLMQGTHLMPQDMKIVCAEGELFIGGAVATADYSGLHVNSAEPPPYYAVIRDQTQSGIVLDTVDIDGNHVPDFRADLGLLTDRGAYVIGHTYNQGSTFIAMPGLPSDLNGIRAVPAVHYELKPGGLYRNGQILAERIVNFVAQRDGKFLMVTLRATSHEAVREVQYQFPVE